MHHDHATREHTQGEQLAPWEKATEWQAVDPTMAARAFEMAERSAADEVEDRRAEMKHRHTMELRLLNLTYAGIGVNLFNIFILAVLAWHFGPSNLPGSLSIVGAGGGLAAGTYFGQQAVAKRILSPDASANQRTKMADHKPASP